MCVFFAHKTISSRTGTEKKSEKEYCDMMDLYLIMGLYWHVKVGTKSDVAT
jgi:hypothetical protein